LAPRTRPNLSKPPKVRVAREADAEALAGFRCSRGRWFQREVEDFIANDLPGRIVSGEVRVLLFHVGDELAAVAAHQPATLVIAEDPGAVAAAHLVAVAIAERLQRATIAGKDRLSDHVLQALLRDALRTHRTSVAFGIVAVENQRSLSMCERNGLASQTLINARYARATGRFATSKQ
jgi:hypothetical protein